MSIVVTNPTICGQPYIGVDAFEIRKLLRALSCKMAPCAPPVFLLEDLGGHISSVSVSASVTWDIVTLTSGEGSRDKGASMALHTNIHSMTAVGSLTSQGWVHPLWWMLSL